MPPSEGSRIKPRIKLCGMTRSSDARQAAEAGADLIGAVLVETSPRQVSAEVAGRLRRAAGLPLALVVADLSPERIQEAVRAAGAQVVQLHGEEEPKMIEELREGGVRELWKAVRVRSEDEILAAADRYGGVVDLLLLDAWHPRLKGGTGRSFPWPALERMRDRLAPTLAVGVAGGLRPGNVSEAVARLRPDLVDVSSGVEVEGRPGVKDPERMRTFVSAVRSVR